MSTITCFEELEIWRFPGGLAVKVNILTKKHDIQKKLFPGDQTQKIIRFIMNNIG